MHFHSADSPDRSCCFCIRLLRSFAFSGGAVGWDAFLPAACAPQILSLSRRIFTLRVNTIEMMERALSPTTVKFSRVESSRFAFVTVRDATYTEIPFCSLNNWTLQWREWLKSSSREILVENWILGKLNISFTSLLRCYYYHNGYCKNIYVFK